MGLSFCKSCQLTCHYVLNSSKKTMCEAHTEKFREELKSLLGILPGCQLQSSWHQVCACSSAANKRRNGVASPPSHMHIVGRDSGTAPCNTLPPLLLLGAKPFAASQVHPACLRGSRGSTPKADFRLCVAGLLAKATAGLVGHKDHAMLVAIPNSASYCEQV